jgi:quinol monooxygenase YgiN
MHAVLVWFEVKPEHRNEFMSAMLTQAENSLNLEEGCRYFDVCTSDEQPDRVFLYELYTDAAAFQAHLDSDHFKAFADTVAPWITGRTIENWHRAYPAGS